MHTYFLITYFSVVFSLYLNFVSNEDEGFEFYLRFNFFLIPLILAIKLHIKFLQIKCFVELWIVKALILINVQRYLESR